MYCSKWVPGHVSLKVGCTLALNAIYALIFRSPILQATFFTLRKRPRRENLPLPQRIMTCLKSVLKANPRWVSKKVV